MIADEIVHLGVTFGVSEDSANHIGMRLWPIPSLVESPSIHNVSHQIEIVTGVQFEKFSDCFCLASSRA